MLNWKSPNAIIALSLIAFAFVIFSIVVFQRMGGDTILGVIVGHIAAWIEIVVVFFFRKKPEVPK